MMFNSLVKKLLTSRENSLKYPHYGVTTSFHGSVQSYQEHQNLFSDIH